MAEEGWVLLNLQLEGYNVKEDPYDWEKDLCELRTQRTPLDYALEFSATGETNAEDYVAVCKKLGRSLICSTRNFNKLACSSSG